jgi:quinolinate synthase
MGNQKKLLEQVVELKKKAFILAHNYQRPEVQAVADFVGDSLGLAKQAVSLQNEIVVFCGVYFMAETAAILNPEKKILIPDRTAGCPLSDFASAQMVREWRRNYPEHTFVAYVNTTAEVKAEVDICCTSSNAVSLVRALPNDKIVFLPDKNLGAWVARNVPEKDIVLWPGYCVVHEFVKLEAVLAEKERYPDALIVAHPECGLEVLDRADGVCSTGQMFDFVRNHPETKRFIVVTESGVNYALKNMFPDKNFIEPKTNLLCRNMKKITLEKVLHCLEKEDFLVKVDSETSERARKAIDNMLQMKT